MCIDDKLKNIKPFLISLRYEGKMPIMDVQFKKGWVVPESKNIKAQKYADELPNAYLFYSDKEGLTMDDISDYISRVIQINVEREEKMVLLRAKIEQLQEFFVENNLSDLKRMEFTIPPEVNEGTDLRDVNSISYIETHQPKIDEDKNNTVKTEPDIDFSEPTDKYVEEDTSKE